MSSPIYNIYRVEEKLGLQDPLMGPDIRYHNSLFIETFPNGGGRFLQVIGTISDATGMTFQESQGPRPDDLDTFHQKHLLGQIRASDSASVVRLLAGIDPPPRQRSFNYNTLAWEKCKPDGSSYGEEELRPPYMKCTEWMLQKAIPALQQSGILLAQGVTAK
ncbi:uncharacterized protein BDR25DRAFT_279425 [Lindgomyces ingoldianus]|uniref:Uncharacterized protein n=1 Tax=Lindgomyces ingoldianus TaxID=673940 RepID=A0ACB6RA91_9PLEO|nr:uncharacterized protein BDR25DRAFT_279425 [Lindgomyces ingoldianus]KAF2475386.1 hypothetical protein BDR25DRAFT_279425 [Lindgomyces ingoldianus]